MKTKWIKRIFGFRSGKPWKSIIAVLYYILCFVFFLIGITTPPIVEAGAQDTIVYYFSVFIIFLWMISPLIFLSDTWLRNGLPFFKKGYWMDSLIGMMIVFILFGFLFRMMESLHTEEYMLQFEAYENMMFSEFFINGSQ